MHNPTDTMTKIQDPQTCGGKTWFCAQPQSLQTYSGQKMTVTVQEMKGNISKMAATSNFSSPFCLKTTDMSKAEPILVQQLPCQLCVAAWEIIRERMFRRPQMFLEKYNCHCHWRAIRCCIVRYKAKFIQVWPVACMYRFIWFIF